MDKKLGETTDLCVEIMNSKRQVTGKLSHAVQIRVCRLTKTGSLTSLISAWAERSLTLRYHGNKRTMKVKFGLPFLSVRIHRKVIHVNFLVFFSAIFAGPLFFKIQKFCYHGNET